MPWHIVLDVPLGCTARDADAARKKLAKLYRPDKGGAADAMARINAACDEAKKLCP